MDDPIRVMVLGSGQMGSGIACLVRAKEGLDLVAVHKRRASADRAPGATVDSDLAGLIQRTRPEVAIQATCSNLDDALEPILILIRHGVAVISIAEEMAYPAARSPAIARQIDQLAITNEVAVLGTGINPGFVLDLLVIALTGVCADVYSISAARVNDLSPYGPTVLKSQGVGLTPEAFRDGLAAGTIRGHIGFEQSIAMIAATLGWEIDRIVQDRAPIVSKVRRETSFVIVAPGQVAGCRHTATAYRDSKPVITLVHPQQIHPHLEGVETGDLIEIKGRPDIHLTGRPEIPGGEATVALAVNMIPHVLNAPPGLYCMADLPVPTAILGDARDFLRRARPGEGDG